MDSKVFEKIAKDVEKVLLGLGDRLTAFTLGKTENPNDRECDYLNKNYTHFCEICKGTPNDINKGEKYLISYFEKHDLLKDKIVNERAGGAGNPNANYLYIATVNKEYNIDDLDGNILPNDYPIILE